MSHPTLEDYLGLEFPWPAGPSIHELIARSSGLTELELPDHADAEQRWAPGARDAVATSQGEFEDETLRAKQVVKALRDLTESGSQAHLDHLHRLATRGPVLGILDQVLGEIVEGPWVNPRALHQLAVFLAREATQRELVKLGVGMLGILSGSDDLDILMTLGRHEEFTLYAVVAIQATREDSEDHLFALAQTVVGWGRIHVVERLADSESPRVHAWLLREGFRSDIMDVYLALLCARVADLATALQRESSDRALLEGAAEMLFALCEGSPDEDIDDYEDAAEACLRYVEALESHPELWSTTHLRTLARIAALLAEGASLDDEVAPIGIEVDADYLWSQRSEQSGWTEERREAVEESCARMLAESRWSELVDEGLRAESRDAYLLAVDGADALGIDTHESDKQRLRDDPTWLGGWHRVAELRSAAPGMLSLFREVVPLQQLGGGPDLRYDFDEETTLEDALAVVLEASVDAEERPWDLLELGLRSPWVRVRATAINAFDAWADSGRIGKSPDEAKEFIEALVEGEPSDELAEMLRASAAGL